MTVYRDRYNSNQLHKLGLNERQIKAVLFVVENGNITSAIYQQQNAIGRTIAAIELKELVTKGIFRQIGSKGRGIHYHFPE